MFDKFSCPDCSVAQIERLQNEAKSRGTDSTSYLVRSAVCTLILCLISENMNYGARVSEIESL